MVFQIAEVNKALGSIIYLVDKDCGIIFDKELATWQDVSLMMHKPTGRTIRFRSERNIWVLDALIEAPVFGRPA